MKFQRATLETCGEARGLVVIVDVLRAFSTAAHAFAAGAREIHLVRKVEEALEQKRAIPNSLAMGEVGGLPPPGFDLGNSPTQFAGVDLQGRTLIQRTGAGTQGAVNSVNAAALLAASFCVAGPSARLIQRLAPDVVTWVISGWTADGRGDEDLACAEYIEALVNGTLPDEAAFVQRVFASPDAQFHLVKDQEDFPRADLDYCTHIDKFDFAMPIERLNGRLVMRAIPS